MCERVKERLSGSVRCRLQSHPEATVLMLMGSVLQVSLSSLGSRQRTPWAPWVPAKASPRVWTAPQGSEGPSGKLQRYLWFWLVVLRCQKKKRWSLILQFLPFSILLMTSIRWRSELPWTTPSSISRFPKCPSASAIRWVSCAWQHNWSLQPWDCVK